jgi:hypothetical protein
MGCSTFSNRVLNVFVATRALRPDERYIGCGVTMSAPSSTPRMRPATMSSFYHARSNVLQARMAGANLIIIGVDIIRRARIGASVSA